MVIKTVVLIAAGIIAVGIVGLVISYNIGKLLTYHRPCGGGRHRG